MKLKQNKGYVGVDISIAVLILLLLVPTIMSVVYALNSSKISAQTEAYAVNIASNAIEIAKSTELTNNYNTDVLNKVKQTYDTDPNVKASTQLDTTNYTATIYLNNASYKLKLESVDYSEKNTDATPNIVKTVKVSVTYKIANKENTIDISTVVK